MNQIKDYDVYLFDYDYFDYDEKELNKRIEVARNIINNNEWIDVFNEWNSYLRTRCKQEKDYINFYELLYNYIDFDMYVPYPNDPYDFLGYMLAKIDLDKNWDLCGDFLDSFAIQILESANELDLEKNPYYRFWKDPKFVEASQKYIS